MTDDAAGVSARERLARLLYEDGRGRSWNRARRSNFIGAQFAVEEAFANADRILADGFGDVAQAKAAAWDEGWAAEILRNPYRSPSANGGGE